jgi:NADPH-dependent curcumin reductase CurA
MVFAFDTLSYARFLRERGVAHEHAEAHAEAARQFIMAELVTKQDLLLVRQDMQMVWQDLQNAVTHFDAKLDNLSLRLTVRLGVLLATGVGALAALVKLT